MLQKNLKNAGFDLLNTKEVLVPRYGFFKSIFKVILRLFVSNSYLWGKDLGYGGGG